MKTKLRVSIGVLLLMLVYGCGAGVPYPVNYPFETQRKMQAARHWAILAEDVTLRIKTGMESVESLADRPVYVVDKKQTPFEEIFHELLIDNLVSRGIPVANSPNGALKLEYTTRLLEHNDRVYQKMPYKFTLIGTGISVARDISGWLAHDFLNIGAGAALDVAKSHDASPPSTNEVIITTTLSYNESFLIHQSDIYYINDPDASHYLSDDGSTNGRINRYGRKFDVVN